MNALLGSIFFGLLGLAFGSFLNVCLSRWPEDESIVQPRSHCRHCSHTLSWWENIPLLSWLLLRGRCRDCRAWIGLRYPLVELAMGILWAFAFFHLADYDLEMPSNIILASFIAAIGEMVFFWLLMALALLDAKCFWLPDRLTLPGAAIGILFLGLPKLLDTFSIVPYRFKDSILALYTVAHSRLLAVVVGAGLILVIRWTYWLIRRREGMGLGDAKLMALLGVWLGLRQTMLCFVLAVFLGTLVAILQLAIPALRNSERWGAGKLPLGTFLCIGGFIASVWGEELVNNYILHAGF